MWMFALTVRAQHWSIVNNRVNYSMCIICTNPSLRTMNYTDIDCNPIGRTCLIRYQHDLTTQNLFNAV